MSFWRKLALGILSPLFVLLLFATAFDIGFIRTATQPSAVKNIIAESGVYDSVVPNLLKQQEEISTPLGDISTADPAIQKAATKAITPQEIRKNAETAIDNIYAWLDGRIPRPSFSFNLAGQQSDFADSIAGSVQQKLAALPACSYSQSLAIARSGTFDAANATCLPRGVTAAGAAQQVKNYLKTNSDFLNSTDITAANLKGPLGQPVFEQSGIKDIPKQYQRAKRTPVILVILTILTGAGIVLLSRSWQAGLKRIGLNLLVIGIMMLIFSWILNRIVSNDIAPNINVDSAVLQQDLRNLVTDIGQRIDRNYWFFGGLYTVLGAAGFAGAVLAQRRTKPPNSSAAVPVNPS